MNDGYIFRSKLGIDVKTFVENKCDAKLVVKRYKKILDDKIQVEWLYIPSDLHYFYMEHVLERIKRNVSFRQ